MTSHNMGLFTSSRSYKNPPSSHAYIDQVLHNKFKDVGFSINTTLSCLVILKIMAISDNL